MPAAGDELLEEARSRARLVEVKGLRVEFAGEFFDRAGIDNGARVRREYLPGREILEKRLVHRMLLHRRRLFAPKLVRMQGGRRCAYLAISMKRTMRQPHARSAPSPACGGGVGRGGEGVSVRKSCVCSLPVPPAEVGYIRLRPVNEWPNSGRPEFGCKRERGRCGAFHRSSRAIDNRIEIVFDQSRQS